MNLTLFQLFAWTCIDVVVQPACINNYDRTESKGKGQGSTTQYAQTRDRNDAESIGYLTS